MSSEDLKLRQMILDEWRLKNDANTAAKNIRAKLGPGTMSSTKVKYWYTRFDKGDTSIFNKNSSSHLQSSESSKNSHNSILVNINNKCLDGKVLTNNGRFAVLPNRGPKLQRVAIFYDLFHGVKKEVSMSGNKFSLFSLDDQFALIGNYLLALSYIEWNLYLFKVNYETWTMSVEFKVSIGRRINNGQFIFDQLNMRRFGIVSSNSIQLGRICGNRIQLLKNTSLTESKNMTLVGNKLRGFHYVNSAPMTFFELNLDTLEKETFAVPIALDNQTDQFVYTWHDTYCWIGNRCYISFQTSDNSTKKILAFNLDTHLWSDTQILPRNVTQIFVDSEEVLTLQSKNTFYRFALKKPEPLKNLAWFSILRGSKVFGGDIYSKIAHRLPYNFDLRCLLETDEEPEELESSKE